MKKNIILVVLLLTFILSFGCNCFGAVSPKGDSINDGNGNNNTDNQGRNISKISPKTDSLGDPKVPFIITSITGCTVAVILLKKIYEK